MLITVCQHISKFYLLITMAAHIIPSNKRYNVLRLPMTRKEYFVQHTKYQFIKLIKETSQLDLDRCLTFLYYTVHRIF